MLKIKRYSPLKALMIAGLLAGSIYSASPVLAGQKHSKNQSSQLEEKVKNESQEESLQFDDVDEEEILSEEEEYKRELVKEYPTIKDMRKEISSSDKLIEKSKQNLRLYGVLAGSSLVNVLANVLGTTNEYAPSLNLMAIFGCAIGGTVNASQKKVAEDEIKYLKGLIKECEEKEPPIEPSELYKK